MELKVEIPPEILEDIKKEVVAEVTEELKGTLGDTVIGAREAAELLGVSSTSMYSIIQENSDFPCVWVGRRIRIVKSALIDWLKKKDYVFITDFDGPTK